MEKEKITTILFDLHGTLVEFQTEEYYSPYGDLIDSMKLTYSQNRIAMHLMLTHDLPTIGDAADFLENRFPGHPIPRDIFPQVEAALKAHLASEALIPGSIETLAELKRCGYKLGLISNLASPYKEPVKTLGISQFLDIAIYSCDVGHAKPEKEIFQKALETIGADAKETIFVGDSLESDVLGSKSVGIWGILFEPSVRSCSEDWIPSIPDIFKILQ